MLISILIGIAALSVIIIAHELGHFISAKATGIKVEEFGLGYPPRLLSFQKGETRYSLNAIPFGGFTRMAGEEDPSEPRNFASKGIGTRLLVLSAGSLMNILLALLLFSITFMIPQDTVMGQVQVEEVAASSPAAEAGIEVGDTILSVNNKEVNNNFDLHRYIQLYLGNDIPILVQHSDTTTEVIRLTPRWKPPEGEGAIGVTISTINATIIRQSYPFWQAIPKGIGAFAETFSLYKNGLISVVIGAASVEFIGPVGIVQLTGEVATEAGISPFLEFTALISFLLGIFNLFPLPALDGGRIVFVLLEWVRRGKRISPKKEGLVHLVGFVLLLGVLVVITFQDIARIISGESILP